MDSENNIARFKELLPFFLRNATGPHKMLAERPKGPGAKKISKEVKEMEISELEDADLEDIG